MWYFSALQLHQTHTGQCLFIFLKACHRIHSGCFDRGMTQNISQSYNILFHTVKGKGVEEMEGQAGWHGKAPSEEQGVAFVNEIMGVQ